jgi:hypothetical protein
MGRLKRYLPTPAYTYLFCSRSRPFRKSERHARDLPSTVIRLLLCPPRPKSGTPRCTISRFWPSLAAFCPAMQFTVICQSCQKYNRDESSRFSPPAFSRLAVLTFIFHRGSVTGRARPSTRYNNPCFPGFRTQATLCCQRVTFAAMCL